MDLGDATISVDKDRDGHANDMGRNQRMQVCGRVVRQGDVVLAQISSGEAIGVQLVGGDERDVVAVVGRDGHRE